MNLKYVVFDVDGVFTNGQFIYDEIGKRYKTFGPHDSDGLKLLRLAGLQVEAISADKRGFAITEKRMIDMDVPLKLVSEQDRVSYIKGRGNLHETCFMGDGHFDSKVFEFVRYSIAPSNAVEITRLKADYVTSSCGGSGAVYEAALHILNLNGES